MGLPGAERLAVYRSSAVCLRAQRERRLLHTTLRGSQPGALVCVRGQFTQLTAGGGRISRAEKSGALQLGKQVTMAARVGRDHGQGGRHRFKHGESETLVRSGREQDPRALQQRRQIVAEAEEAHGVVDSETQCEVGQVGTKGPDAGNVQTPPVCRDAGLGESADAESVCFSGCRRCAISTVRARRSPVRRGVSMPECTTVDGTWMVSATA